MSITDELRRYAANWDGWFYDDKDGGLIHAIGHIPVKSTPVPRVINDIADRIDERHERALTAAHSNGITEYGSMVAREYVKLPVDADGVPIHVGDYVETLIEAFKGERGRVECLTLTEDGWCVDGDAPSTVRHVKPDSWERIITEAMRFARTTNVPYPEVEDVGKELVERCKRLAGGAE